MFLQIVVFLLGLGILYLGAEWLIKGASSLALRFGIRPMVVGLTVVALGTSMPEFLINFFAAMSNEDSLALGNIVGSNICNIALILGTSSLLVPLVVQPTTLRKEYPIMMLVMVVFYLLSLDGLISQLDGVILVLGLIGFFIHLVIDGRKHAEQLKQYEQLEDTLDADHTASVTGEEAAPYPKTLNRIALVLGGMIALAIGARFMVVSAVNIADSLGVHRVVVGLTVVAIGTSLPELAASVVCAIKKEADMSVGNVLGSNMLNVLFVVGLVSLISPLEVDPESISIHFPVMLGFCLLLLPLAWTQYRITRFEGGILLTGFFSYMVYLVLPYV